MPFLQNGLQAHSDSTFNINTSDGVRSHFVETTSWGVHTHFVVGTHFVLQNGVRNPTGSIGRGVKIGQLFWPLDGHGRHSHSKQRLQRSR